MDPQNQSHQQQQNQLQMNNYNINSQTPVVLNDHYTTYSQNRSAAVNTSSYYPPQVYEPLTQPSLHQSHLQNQQQFLPPPLFNPYQQQQQQQQISPFLLQNLTQHSNNQMNASNQSIATILPQNSSQMQYGQTLPPIMKSVHNLSQDEEQNPLMGGGNNHIQAQPGYPYHNQHYNNPYIVQSSRASIESNENQQQNQFVKRVQADHSIHMKCAYCGQDGPTKVNTYNGAASWGSCVLLFCCGFYLCSCIPLCVPCCKDAEHRCGRCHKIIAAKRAFI
eukprot:403358299